MRFRDQSGNTTPWFDIEDTPKFLAAGFTNCQKVYVDRLPFPGEALHSWYSMDDLSYNEGGRVIPEAGSLLLAMTGGVPLLGLAIRRRRA